MRHVASTALAGEPRRLELAGAGRRPGRGSARSAAAVLGAGLSAAPGVVRDRGRRGRRVAVAAGDPAPPLRPGGAAERRRRGLRDARAARPAQPRAPRRRAHRDARRRNRHGRLARAPAGPPSVTLTPVSQDAAGSSIDAANYSSAALARRRVVPRLPPRRLREHREPLPGAVHAHRQRPVEHGVSPGRAAERARPADRPARDPAADRRDDPGRSRLEQLAQRGRDALRKLHPRNAAAGRSHAPDARRARRPRDRRRLDGRLWRDERRAGQPLPLRRGRELAQLLQRARRQTCAPTVRSSSASACTRSSTAAKRTTSPTPTRTRPSRRRCGPRAPTPTAPSTPANTTSRRSKRTSRACSPSRDARSPSGPEVRAANNRLTTTPCELVCVPGFKSALSGSLIGLGCST